MNAKEKIEKIFFAYIDNGEGGAEIDFDGFYDHLIKEFPQIYSERVFKARVKFSDLKDCEQFLSGYIGKKIEVYIKEVVS